MSREGNEEIMVDLFNNDYLDPALLENLAQRLDSGLPDEPLYPDDGVYRPHSYDQAAPADAEGTYLSGSAEQVGVLYSQGGYGEEQSGQSPNNVYPKIAAHNYRAPCQPELPS
jgi:hypothetical protein